jgi:hypothetical protein
MSLSVGHFPSEWKSARIYIVPLVKSGKPEIIDNYRPISILPIASKILERAVHKQLYSFLTNNNLLSPYQFGFRKQHSTETASIFFNGYNTAQYGPRETNGCSVCRFQ